MINRTKLIEELERAIALASIKHKGQLDKGGNPYILHPINVMKEMYTLQEKIIAVLHDIIEDTDVDEHFLKAYGINEIAIKSISTLTKKEEDSYMEYIKKVSQDYFARRVKIVDLEQNMDLSRLTYVTEADIRRKDKYIKAHKYLMSHGIEGEE